MNDFEKLKNMNLEDVKNITKISMQRLRDIVNKDFKNIDATRAQGFIKILERDLHLDLREWIQEYNYFLKNGSTQGFSPDKVELDSKIPESKNIESKKDFEPPKVTQSYKKDSKNKKQKSLTSGNIEVTMPKSKKSYKASVLLLVGLIIVLLIAFVSYFANMSAPSDSEIIKENNKQKQEVEDKISQTYPKISLEKALDSDTENQNIESNIVDSKNTESSEPTSHKVVINAKKQVWFAWIDTGSKKGNHKVLNPNDSFALDSNNPIAFHFGNSNISINADGEDFEYKQGSVIYLLYTPNEGIKQITQKEYNALGRK